MRSTVRDRRSKIILRLPIALLATTLLGSCTASAPEPGRPSAAGTAGSDRGPTASSAETFVQSIGINTHLSYLDTRFPDGSTMTDKIKQSGITNLRDCPCIAAPEYPGDTSAVTELTAAGIRFSLVADYHDNSAQQIHDRIIELGPQHVQSVENRNEPELFDARADGSWPVTEVRDYQQELFQAIKSDPATRDVEVLGPSLTSADAADAFGGSVAASMDRANLHNYPGGLEPENRGWDDEGYGSLDFALRRIAAPVKPGVPPVSTETGYDNAVGSGDGQSVPESVAGRYLPRQYLHSFAAGIPRTYPYEFFDEGTDRGDPEQNFGLIRNDGSPKPTYTAIRSMIGLLHDPGPAFAPGRLDMAVDAAPDGLQQVLLQKRDGTFFLAVWLGKRGWDRDTRTEIAVPDADTTITLPASVSNVMAHRLDGSGALTARPLEIRGSRIQVPVGDEVTFVELGAAGGR